MSETRTWMLVGRPKYTLWTSPLGYKFYKAKFTDSLPQVGKVTEECTIYFWAYKPSDAVRKIIASGKHPREFDDQKID